MSKIKMWLPGYLFILPVFVLFALFMYVPIVNGLLHSFQQWSFDGSRWIGFDNYVRNFQDVQFWQSLRITVVFTLATVVAGLALSTALAVAIDPLGRKLTALFKTAFYLPTVAPIVVVSVVWSWLLHPTYGLLNYLLRQLGSSPVLWLADSQMALLSIILMSVAVGQGANILILTAALGGIPKEYEESMRIDGASAWRELISLKLPLVKPTMLYLVVVNTIGSFQVFAPVYMMTSGGPNGGTTTLGFLIYENGFKKFDFGYASAQGVVLLFLVLAIAFVQYRFLSSDVEY